MLIVQPRRTENRASLAMLQRKVNIWTCLYTSSKRQFEDSVLVLGLRLGKDRDRVEIQ